MASAKALILEHSEEAAALIRQYLEERRISVVGWNRTGKNWINLYSEHRPDYVFADLLLPERDGIYCINKLCLQVKEICCIFTHSYSGEHANMIEQKAFRAGAMAVLQKPFPRSRFDIMMDRFEYMRGQHGA
jgi:two-component system chemotaxis response regulator CheY